MALKVLGVYMWKGVAGMEMNQKEAELGEHIVLGESWRQELDGSF